MGDAGFIWDSNSLVPGHCRTFFDGCVWNSLATGAQLDRRDSRRTVVCGRHRRDFSKQISTREEISEKDGSIRHEWTAFADRRIEQRIRETWWLVIHQEVLKMSGGSPQRGEPILLYLFMSLGRAAAAEVTEAVETG